MSILKTQIVDFLSLFPFRGVLFHFILKIEGRNVFGKLNFLEP